MTSMTRHSSGLFSVPTSQRNSHILPRFVPSESTTRRLRNSVSFSFTSRYPGNPSSYRTIRFSKTQRRSRFLELDVLSDVFNLLPRHARQLAPEYGRRNKRQ